MSDLTEVELDGLRRAARTAHDQFMQLFGTICEVEDHHPDLGLWVLAAMLEGPGYSGTAGDIVRQSARAREGLRVSFGGALSPQTRALRAAAEALTPTPPQLLGDWVAPIVEGLSVTELWALAGMMHDRAAVLAGDSAPPPPASYCADTIARALADYASACEHSGRRLSLRRFLREWQAEEDDLEAMLDEAIAKDC
jgi:hypothetical protein